ncbi:MAG: amidohydrolase [Synergistaceae bacterium]|jgi:amidohydrolase|nr:amidohydrolase [Synergistaceae bacterium]
MDSVTGIIDKIKTLAKEGEKEIVDLRRHFHMNPETSWNEVETTKRIVEELEKIGVENVRSGFGGTECGVTADIVGAKPGKCVALRADIDALPLNDEKDVPYKSRKAGAMHACGHDSHASMLIGAAKALTALKSELKGKVRLLFQPAEEHGIRPGAKALIDGGALEGVEGMFGIHVMSSIPSGMLEYRAGPFMAGADSWEATIAGKGGHGSAPELAVDPTIAAFQIGNAIQTVISREVPPRDTAVVSIGGIKTSSYVFNIIPDRVEMCGTVRTFRPEVQDSVEAALVRLFETIGEACRCKVDFKYNRLLPATINDGNMTALAKSVAEAALGEKNVRESELVMGSEDFSHYGRIVPAVFVNLGTACAEKKSDMPHHSPKFDVDESVLWQGAVLHAVFAWRFLEEN